MPFNINTIRTLLDAHLLSVAGDVPVQTENTRITPGVDPWMRSTVLPANSQVAAFGGGVVLKAQGIYQVDLMYPAGVGLDAVSAMAEAVCGAFFAGTQLTDGSQVVLTTNVSQFAAQVDAQMNYSVPLRIEWQSYVTQ